MTLLQAAIRAWNKMVPDEGRQFLTYIQQEGKQASYVGGAEEKVDYLKCVNASQAAYPLG
jgi:hypothetical protein